jgi:hypothetical protein
MTPRTMVAFNLTGTVIFVSVFYWLGRDHSLIALARWVALFATAIVLPMYWSGKVEAELVRLPGPLPLHLRRAALYPVLVGIMTLCAAAALFDGVP